MLHKGISIFKRIAGASGLACLLGLALVSCGGGDGGGNNSNFTPPDSGGRTSCAHIPSPAGLPVITLQVSSELACAEVASTPEQRERGLMGRQGLATDSGMLFDFSEPTSICMWMRETSIPLSVAFVDQGGMILNIEDMEPMTTTLHCSISSARYSLEMERGWFGQNNITQGSRVTGLP